MQAIASRRITPSRLIQSSRHQNRADPTGEPKGDRGGSRVSTGSSPVSPRNPPPATPLRLSSGTIARHHTQCSGVALPRRQLPVAVSPSAQWRWCWLAGVSPTSARNSLEWEAESSANHWLRTLPSTNHQNNHSSPEAHCRGRLRLRSEKAAAHPSHWAAVSFVGFSGRRTLLFLLLLSASSWAWRTLVRVPRRLEPIQLDPNYETHVTTTTITSLMN